MRNLINKKILIAIMTVVIIIVVSIITIFLLKAITSKKTTVETTLNKTLSADEVIESFKITKLSEKDYIKLNDSPAILQYKSSAETIGVNLSIKSSIMYTTNNTKNSKDTPEVQSQTTTFMKNSGFEADDTTIYNNNKTMAYKTFSSSHAVCQLVSTDEPVVSSQSHFHQLSCVSKKSITDQYDAIKKLLSTIGSPAKPSDYMLAFVISNSKDNIKYSILSLNSKTKHQNLLFASVDDNWEYLGDLLGGGKQYATEKYSITPELQVKINDAKYKGFLKESLVKG